MLLCKMKSRQKPEEKMRSHVVRASATTRRPSAQFNLEADLALLVLSSQAPSHRNARDGDGHLDASDAL
jgi:hypothetical protein